MIPIVELLGKMLGSDYEIVLHDVSDGNTSIVALVNGNLTGRLEIGEGLTSASVNKYITQTSQL